MGIKEGIIAVAAAAGAAFADVNQPYIQQMQMTPTPDVACTVRLNHFQASDKAPVDRRYIDTPYAPELTRDGPHARQLFPSPSLSGITYTQKGDIQDKSGIFFAQPVLTPIVIDMMFVQERTMDNRLQANGKYKDPSHKGGEGKFESAEMMNWSESFQVDIQNPLTCLQVRKSIVQWPPAYGGLFSGTDSDGFAKAVWALTGKSNDPAKLKKDPDIIWISREMRLQEQDPPPANLLPPFRPRP